MIGFHPGKTVQQVDAAGRQLEFGGTREPFDLLVAVPPHRPPPAVAGAGLGPDGWIPVDPRT